MYLFGGGVENDFPKFKFSVECPIGLHVIMQLEIKKKKSKLPNILSAKLFQPKIRRGPAWHPSWNNVEWILFINYTVIRMLYMQRSRKSVLPNWIGLFLPPLLF